MNFRVTLADESGNEDDVVMWRVEFKDIGELCSVGGGLDRSRIQVG